MELAQAIDLLERTGLAEVQSSAIWTDADFDRFKTETELVMPTQLRAILASYGKLFLEELVLTASFDGGKAQKTEVSRLGGSVDELIKSSTQYLDVYNTKTGALFEKARAPEGYIHIGEAEGKRARILMDGVNPDNNAVHLWGIAFDPWGEGDNTLGLGYIADSLVDWIIHLSQHPDG